MNEPTQVQWVTLLMIQKLYLENMYPPTVRDLAEMVGVSTKAMYDRIEGMRKKGMFQHESKLIPIGVKVVRDAN